MFFLEKSGEVLLQPLMEKFKITGLELIEFENLDMKRNYFFWHIRPVTNQKRKYIYALSAQGQAHCTVFPGNKNIFNFLTKTWCFTD